MVLGIFGGGSLHGFGVAAITASGGELGRIFSVKRVVVYRTVHKLHDMGLIEPLGNERSVSGPERSIFGITAEGRWQLHVWLRTPVDHIREVDGPLLLKLALLKRLRLDAQPLVAAQIAQFEPLVARLECLAVEPCSGFASTLLFWQVSTARNVMEFLDHLIKR